MLPAMAMAEKATMREMRAPCKQPAKDVSSLLVASEEALLDGSLPEGLFEVLVEGAGIGVVAGAEPGGEDTGHDEDDEDRRGDQGDLFDDVPYPREGVAQQRLGAVSGLAARQVSHCLSLGGSLSTVFWGRGRHR